MFSTSPPRNIDEFLKEPYLFYKILGWDPFDRNRNFHPSKLWTIFYYFNLINLIAFIAGQVVTLLIGTNITGLVTKMPPFICFLYSSIFWGKTVSILAQKKTICNILDEIDDIFPRNAMQREAFRFDRFATELSGIYRLLKYASFSSIFAYVFGSLVAGILNLWRNGNFLYLVPVPIWRTFDSDSIGSYVTFYLNQAYGIHVCNTGIFAADSVLYHLIAVMCMFFEYISQQFKMATPKLGNPLGKLRQLIRFHDRILRISATINDVFSISVLLNLLLSSVNLCMIGFQVVGGLTIGEFLRHTLLLGLQLLQIFILCYMAQRLTDCSIGISLSAFDHYLTNFDVDSHKYLLRIIQRSQRPAVINAPLLSAVSMETLRKVNSIAFQFFTLLNSIKN